MQQRDQIILQSTTQELTDNQTVVKKRSLDNNNDSKNQLADYEQSKKKILTKRYGGMLLTLNASFFFSITFLIVKILGSRGFEPFACSILFNLGILVPCMIGILVDKTFLRANSSPSIFEEIWPLNDTHKKKIFTILLLQGTLQGFSVIFRNVSLRYLSIGDMTVIVFSSPVVTNLIAHFLVGEPFGIFFVFTAILTLCGVAMIVKPPFVTGATTFDYNTSVGSGIAVAAMFCLSIKFAITRKIKKTNYLLMTLFVGGSGFIISLPLFLAFEDWTNIVPKQLTEYFLIIGLMTAFVSIACINLALKNEDAGPVSLIRSCDVIFAFLFQYIFLQVIPDTLSAIGAGVVVSGIFLTGLRKWLMLRSSKQQRNETAVPSEVHKSTKV